jgi:hypothetical protein
MAAIAPIFSHEPSIAAASIIGSLTVPYGTPLFAGRGYGLMLPMGFTTLIVSGIEIHHSSSDQRANRKSW